MIMANMLTMPGTAAPMPPKPGGVMPAPPPVAPKPAANALATNALSTTAMTPQKSPYAAAMAPKPQSLVNGAIDGFMRGFRPEQYQADQDKTKADGAERAKQTLALMQQQRQIPAEQRAQWWQQNADQIGQIVGADVKSLPMDENSFSDQALDGQIAMMSAKLGIAPATPEGPKVINNKLVDPKTGQVVGDYSDPQKPMAVNNRLVDPTTGEVIGDYSDAATPKTFNTGQAIVSIDPVTNKPTVLYRDPQNPSGSSARLRPATPQEAEQYGPPGTMGQIDTTTGRFYPTARPNPQTGGLATEGERKFGLYAKTARDALADIEKIEFENGIDKDPTFDRGGQLNPFDGTARKYDQAIDRFLDGWSRAMTGAAMTNDEKQFYYGIMKPTFGDDPSVRKQKAVERQAMVERLKEAAARGYTEPKSEVIIPQGIDPADWDFMTDEQKALFQ